MRYSIKAFQLIPLASQSNPSPLWLSSYYFLQLSFSLSTNPPWYCAKHKNRETLVIIGDIHVTICVKQHMKTHWLKKYNVIFFYLVTTVPSAAIISHNNQSFPTLECHCRHFTHANYARAHQNCTVQRHVWVISHHRWLWYKSIGWLVLCYKLHNYIVFYK